MKQFVSTMLCFILIVSLFSACTVPEGYEPKEQPHLYWKDIDAVVTDVSERHWFATTHHYILEVEVYSEEYNLKTILSEQGSGMFAPSHWGIQKGDTVKVKLYSWVMDSTGEVIRRKIHSFS